MVGAACLGLAIWMRASEVHSFGLRMPLWTLLAAIGVTVGAGGLALTLVEEPDEQLPEGHSDLVMVQREVWEKLQEEVGSIPEEALVPSPPPAPDYSEEPPASAPETSATGAPVFDPALVARVSDDLIREPRTSSASTAPAPRPASISSPPGAAAPGTSGAPTTIVAAPPAGAAVNVAGTGLETVARPTLQPQWKEDAIDELQSVLAQVQKDARPAGTLPPARPPTARVEQCVGCGATVGSYSEQACVVCDRPLCDTCLELSVTEGRPAICPTCPRPAEN